MITLKDPSLLKQHAYVNGQWIDALNGETNPVLNPATGEQIATVPDLGVEETEAAIAAADVAFKSWKKKTAKERSVLLRKWFELIVANKDDLAILMTAEQGKPIAESAGEVLYGASFIEWYAEEGKRAYGDVIPSHAADKRIIVTKEPIGVTAAITPWNFPNAMITRKCAPALAVGCTMIIKPAEDTPLSALALMELADRAGIPAGVINVITTKRPIEVGKTLTDSSVVRKLSFTGSTPVGKQLMRQCADTVKKTSMELGGNAPLIIFDDADLDKAVPAAIASKYRNSGQTCVCANRLLIQSGIYEEFAQRYAAEVAKLQVGNCSEGEFQQGPLINRAALDKVTSMVDDAVAKGARIISGGKPHALGGNFYEPTIVADITNDMRLAHEEIFGPVAPLFRFDTEEEAVQIANDTEFGLAAYFFTRDYARVFRVSEALEYGMVAVNDGILSTEVAPFGGVKESGTGREGSKYGMEDYLEIKYTLVGGL
ncbi:succinate-semialdehyde dehydrogenase / glutarate-semialdehyde dehydrogenase [Amphritea atlantica]|uniref:Succinate-semialdehyde dehydrogenase / glutarate-semialdehyde dehydrogenase n=1 Tax=Amphritea atlantica TaxID=355243 RepID=A0A1H9GCM7_9GAMM|nr:NAD-dependent succinate-semialdehyde dehydrogenase [Amphritea atlantica]SEQ47854.1 succinate-semialdehyde dehydrogenase / glutarate-semialdehyde dehydrogenase [Amphritea atlantica]